MLFYTKINPNGLDGKGNQGKQGDNQNNQGNQDNHDNPNGCGHGKSKRVVCPSKVCEDVKVTIPVEVRATVDVKNISLQCKGHHIKEYEGSKSRIHKFEIIQEVQAQIPIDVITEVEVEDERVDFHARKCH